MVVQHNLTAMNANRQLGITTNAQAKSSEKLSSGYRINRAGDDAAGLKISEKMRSQIRGLDKASSNAQDGISLIQTAEGALGEAHSILQRMNELAVQGANDTNESIDRDAINEELSALTSELDRIASTTQFNKQNLLDGSFTSKNLQVGANSDQKISISIGEMNSKALGLHNIAGPRLVRKLQDLPLVNIQQQQQILQKHFRIRRKMLLKVCRRLSITQKIQQVICSSSILEQVVHIILMLTMRNILQQNQR